MKPSPVIQLHLHLLPDGRVLSWGEEGAPQLWDPATGDFTAAPSPSLLFCSGHDFLPDGRLLVAGGHISNSHGLPNTNIFDPVSGSWQTGAPMAKGRWYPTTTTLPSGELLALSGQDQTGAIVDRPRDLERLRLAPAHDREPVAARTTLAHSWRPTAGCSMRERRSSPAGSTSRGRERGPSVRA